MKKIKNICLCAVISLVCLFAAAVVSDSDAVSLIPVARAAENGTWGSNIEWTLDDNGVLTLLGTGDMQNSTNENPFPWLTYSSDIKEIVLEKGVTSVAKEAFMKCEALTDLTISEDVTVIYSYAFRNCSSLKNISFPENSSLQSVLAYAFEYCEALEYIFIPETVKTLGAGAFYFSGIKSVEIPENAVLESLPDRIFAGTDIDTIHIPASVKSISVTAFRSTANLKEITVSENNPYYTSIDGVLFQNEEMLVHYPTAKTGNEYTIPDGVKHIRSQAFYKNQYIVTLNIPKTVTQINKNACENMLSLEYVNFEDGILLEKITESSFSNNKALKEITVPASVKEIESQGFAYCDNVHKIVFEENSQLETIGSHSFARIYGISESITIPPSVKTIGSGAFSECKMNGNAIIIPENSILETIEQRAFSDVRLYERTLYLPSSVKTIGERAFYWSSTSSSSRHIVTINYGGSEEQWNLIDINDNNSEIFNADIVFDYNSSLYDNLSVELNGAIIKISGSGETPSSSNPSYRVWNEYKNDATAVIIDGEISKLGKNSFADFSELTYVIIRSHYIRIEDGAFNNCPRLETVVILGDSEFSENAFIGCAEGMRIFEEKSKQHTFISDTDNISVIPFSYSEKTLVLEGKLRLDSYEFFDTVSVFAAEYENISKLKFSSIAFEDIVLYRYDEENMSRVPIDDNTLTDGELYVQGFVDGEIRDLTFNELCKGIADGSITSFYLIANDESGVKVEDTQVEIVEQMRNIFLRAIRWVVTLMNKLFTILKSFFG